MAIDKELYSRVRKEQREVETVKSVKNFNIQLLKRESVRCASLVGSADWDSYLGYLQTVITGLEGVREEAMTLLEDPRIIDHDSLLNAKMVFREAKSSLDILYQVIQLPYAILHAEASISDITSNIPLPELPDFLKPKKSFWR